MRIISGNILTVVRYISKSHLLPKTQPDSHKI